MSKFGRKGSARVGRKGSKGKFKPRKVHHLGGYRA